MGSLAICPECGRTHDDSFRFCPWCGASRERVALAALVDNACSRIERTYRNGVDFRISDMEARLGEMETELDRILS